MITEQSILDAIREFNSDEYVRINVHIFTNENISSLIYKQKHTGFCWEYMMGITQAAQPPMSDADIIREIALFDMSRIVAVKAYGVSSDWRSAVIKIILIDKEHPHYVDFAISYI